LSCSAGATAKCNVQFDGVGLKRLRLDIAEQFLEVPDPAWHSSVGKRPTGLPLETRVASCPHVRTDRRSRRPALGRPDKSPFDLALGCHWRSGPQQTIRTVFSENGLPLAERRVPLWHRGKLRFNPSRQADGLKPMTKELEMKRLRGVIDHFDGRRQRAAERLRGEDTPRWFFALVGLEIECDHELGDLLRLRQVVEPPGEVELAAALANKTLMSAVARYSHSVRHELCVERKTADDDQQSGFNLAWWFLSALRVRTLAEFLVPAVSDHSWSTIAGVSEGTCQIALLEDVTRARRFAGPICVTSPDLVWVDEHLTRFIDLLEKPAFRLAVDSLTTHQHEASLRMTTASLWAGVEALFGISTELRFRLASLIAAFLEERGKARVGRYRSVKKLYDFRSRAVHGAVVDDSAMHEHIRQVRLLLSSLLCKIAELGHFPSEDDWETALFG
jgi:hypothetical protein